MDVFHIINWHFNGECLLPRHQSMITPVQRCKITCLDKDKKLFVLQNLPRYCSVKRFKLRNLASFLVRRNSLASRLRSVRVYTALQSHKAVTAYLNSKQILSVCFTWQSTSNYSRGVCRSLRNWGECGGRALTPEEKITVITKEAALVWSTVFYRPHSSKKAL